MTLLENGIYIIRGELSTLITAMRRGSTWKLSSNSDENQDRLMKIIIDLKENLSRNKDIRQIDPNIYLSPFLEIIRTDETTGVVTSLALATVKKIISCGFIDLNTPNLPIIVENIVDSVTHARFMGTDQASDGITLFRVVDVMHTLMRSPIGAFLSNESVCEIMLSCFKICFEPRINEILRRSTEQALKDMVFLIFMRLPQFPDNKYETSLAKKLPSMTSSIEKSNKTKIPRISKSPTSSENIVSNSPNLNDSTLSVIQENNKDNYKSPNTLNVNNLKEPSLATTPSTPAGTVLDMKGKIIQSPKPKRTLKKKNDKLNEEEEDNIENDETPNDNQLQINEETTSVVELKNNIDDANSYCENEYINSVGIRFTQEISNNSETKDLLVPYGLPCVQELFRFLILLSNPLDKQNTDAMLHLGLTLLTVAFEVASDNIGKHTTLLSSIKDDLCRNLIALLNCERLTIFSANLQLCFLLFQSSRQHLKFQLESYLKKLSEIIASDNPKTNYEIRELALENLMHFWRIPGFVTELYINYDCDLYCIDMFGNLSNLLSKYTLSASNAVYTTHYLAMDTLISVIENIEKNCVANKNLESLKDKKNLIETELSQLSSDINNKFNAQNKMITNSDKSVLLTDEYVSRDYLKNVKHKKRILTQGTDIFNQRPDKGIQYLQENGILNKNLDPMEVALFLRENHRLDKKMIGEYISKKKNVDLKILMNFVNSFDFAGLRIDQALRLYLETFRLPGEAPLIFLVLEYFADHWHKQNGEPFVNTDAAFSLAYAIIMLNMDQHNSNAKRLNVPMTQEDFLKNLRGLNGGSDFEQDMLSQIFYAIKHEEIVMPAEQTGLVRENYLWKVLLRRGMGNDGVFHIVENSTYDLDIFNIIWGDFLSALSFMYEKSNEHSYQKILTGFTRSAGILAHYNLHKDFDALILTLFKFTTLLYAKQQDDPPIYNEMFTTINFGLNFKAQASVKTIFMLVHNYGDCLRECWKNVLELFLQFYRLKLLPKSFMEVEDFCEVSGKAELLIERPSQKQEAGLFSSLYSYLSSEAQREPSYEEQECIKIAKKCIKECQLEQMIQESKFLQLESLQELLGSILNLLKEPKTHKSMNIPYSEETVVFWMEFLVKIVFHNRDRMISLWPSVRDRIYLLILGGATRGYEYLLNRGIIAILKLAIYLMRNEELCSMVLQSLKMLLIFDHSVILRISNQISIGIYELLKTSAQNIHSEKDWQIIFTILECVGAGARPPKFEDDFLIILKPDASNNENDTLSIDKEFIPNSDSESKVCNPQTEKTILKTNTRTSSPIADNWIIVNKEIDSTYTLRGQSLQNSNLQTVKPSLLLHNCKLSEHSPFALFKCWDSLAFIVRNVAHITPYNFDSCVRCIRTFVEASCDGGQQHLCKEELVAGKSTQKIKNFNKFSERKSNDPNSTELINDAENKHFWQRYETLSIQLLDLMYTLYTRTAQIFRWWAEEESSTPQCSALWEQGWCPLLQGIARLAMDRRRDVRIYAISCLQQRALLVHDLQTLSGVEWSSCFYQVLFPLLNELLPESSFVEHLDSVLLEESRIRIATIMSKVFLHHLTPLIELNTGFDDLWMEILNYIEKFIKVGSDMLSEQMQEILKNMLLVMHSVQVFHRDDGTIKVQLWELTWHKIAEFLPNLKTELFNGEEDNKNHPLLKYSIQLQKLEQQIDTQDHKDHNKQDYITNQQIIQNQQVQHSQEYENNSKELSQGLTSNVLPDLLNDTSVKVNLNFDETNVVSPNLKIQDDNQSYYDKNVDKFVTSSVIYNDNHSILIELPETYYHENENAHFSNENKLFMPTNNTNANTDFKEKIESEEEVEEQQTNLDFPSVNYLNINVDAKNIPKGSEILYTRP